MNIFRASAEFPAHNAQPFFSDAFERPAPAGMECADGSVAGIDQQDGKAVSGENAQRDVRKTGDQTIANQWAPACERTT